VWLPGGPGPYGEVPGLTNRGDSEARSVNELGAGGQLRDYQIPGSDSEIRDGSEVEFFFEMNGLYCGRLTDPGASDWYRRVRPWAISLRNIAIQRGGVTILNNVINPLQGEKVTLLYSLPKSGMVTIQVFDLKGDIVDVLLRERREAGSYSTTWDGRNRGGRIVARGVYFVKVVAPEIEEIRKVLVVK
ncbi:MAG TPA: FlgD immunoglobulin-like domain containing protein, partial [Spirochaetia bacterium]|nr:FlgD immunoglobulin-like domain containing protein [Spirochaetia bacterium]